MILRAAQCQQVGGTYQGDNTVCSANSCVPPAGLGACCIPASTDHNAACVRLTEAGCEERGGAFQGAGTQCFGDTCPRECPCDWNNDGRIQQADLYAFLNSYFAGHGDFNGDGVTNGADLMEFIACFNNVPEPCTR